MSEFHSFLRLNNTSIIWVYYTLFIHSSIDEWIFYLLAVVNNASVNIGIQISVQVLSNLLAIYPEAESGILSTMLNCPQTVDFAT